MIIVLNDFIACWVTKTGQSGPKKCNGCTKSDCRASVWVCKGCGSQRDCERVNPLLDRHWAKNAPTDEIMDQIVSNAKRTAEYQLKWELKRGDMERDRREDNG